MQIWARFKCTQVIASTRKSWPNRVTSYRKFRNANLRISHFKAVMATKQRKQYRKELGSTCVEWSNDEKTCSSSRIASVSVPQVCRNFFSFLLFGEKCLENPKKCLLRPRLAYERIWGPAQTPHLSCAVSSSTSLFGSGTVSKSVFFRQISIRQGKVSGYGKACCLLQPRSENVFWYGT